MCGLLRPFCFEENLGERFSELKGRVLDQLATCVPCVKNYCRMRGVLEDKIGCKEFKDTDALRCRVLVSKLDTMCNTPLDSQETSVILPMFYEVLYRNSMLKSISVYKSLENAIMVSETNILGEFIEKEKLFGFFVYLFSSSNPVKERVRKIFISGNICNVFQENDRRCGFIEDLKRLIVEDGLPVGDTVIVQNTYVGTGYVKECLETLEFIVESTGSFICILTRVLDHIMLSPQPPVFELFVVLLNISIKIVYKIEVGRREEFVKRFVNFIVKNRKCILLGIEKSKDTILKENIPEINENSLCGDQIEFGYLGNDIIFYWLFSLPRYLSDYANVIVVFVEKLFRLYLKEMKVFFLLDQKIAGGIYVKYRTPLHQVILLLLENTKTARICRDALCGYMDEIVNDIRIEVNVNASESGTNLKTLSSRIVGKIVDLYSADLYSTYHSIIDKKPIDIFLLHKVRKCLIAILKDMNLVDASYDGIYINSMWFGILFNTSFMRISYDLGERAFIRDMNSSEQVAFDNISRFVGVFSADEKYSVFDGIIKAIDEEFLCFVRRLAVSSDLCDTLICNHKLTIYGCLGVFVNPNKEIFRIFLDIMTKVFPCPEKSDNSESTLNHVLQNLIPLSGDEFFETLNNILSKFILCLKESHTLVKMNYMTLIVDLVTEVLSHFGSAKRTAKTIGFFDNVFCVYVLIMKRFLMYIYERKSFELLRNGAYKMIDFMNLFLKHGAKGPVQSVYVPEILKNVFIECIQDEKWLSILLKMFVYSHRHSETSIRRVALDAMENGILYFTRHQHKISIRSTWSLCNLFSDHKNYFKPHELSSFLGIIRTYENEVGISLKIPVDSKPDSRSSIPSVNMEDVFKAINEEKRSKDSIGNNKKNLLPFGYGVDHNSNGNVSKIQQIKYQTLRENKILFGNKPVITKPLNKDLSLSKPQVRSIQRVTTERSAKVIPLVSETSFDAIPYIKKRMKIGESTEAQDRIEFYRKIENFYREILSLCSGDGECRGNSRHLRESKVPLEFESCSEYFEVFQKFVIEEVMTQLRSFDGSMKNENNFYIEIRHVYSSDDFWDVQFSIINETMKKKGDDASLGEDIENCALEGSVMAGALCNEEFFIHDLDYWVIENGSEGKPKRFSGIVLSSSIKHNEHYINVRCFPERGSNMNISDLINGSRWRFNKIVNLTTYYREYVGLVSFPYFKHSKILLDPGKAYREYGKSFSVDPSIINNIGREYDLNGTQAYSVYFSVYDKDFPFNLIKGPPGTGKTVTILAILREYLRIFRSQKENKCIMVCAPSNAAVDEIALRFIKKEGKRYKIVRFGSGDSINKDIREYSFDNLVSDRLGKYFTDIKSSNMEMGKEYEELCSLATKTQDSISKAGSSMDYSEINYLNRRRLEINNKIKEIRERKMLNNQNYERKKLQVKEEILQGVELLFCTLNGSGHEVLTYFDNMESGHPHRSWGDTGSCHKKFSRRFIDVLVIDEACQCTEVSSIIPLRYGAKRIIMVGDPNQLPPTVLSRKSIDSSYDRPLFSRILSHCPGICSMLKVQYRMHKEIRTFPSYYFYSDSLIDYMNSDKVREWHHKSRILRPYVVIDVPGKQVQRRNSLGNPLESHVVIGILKHFCRTCPDMSFSKKIGIVSPYKGQVSTIERELCENILSTSHVKRGEIENLIKLHIEINTVDGFQGKEKDIIILSCVRTTESTLGFLKDIRRLNVALTRAISTLIIVMNRTALENQMPYSDLIKDSVMRRSFVPYTYFLREIGKDTHNDFLWNILK